MFYVPQDIKEIIDILHTENYCPFLVGGCVRDTVMGIAPKDYDITVRATPEDISECFQKRGYRVIPKGREFGTVGVLVGNQVVEITPYRIEGGYTDSRHPENVEFVDDIRLDLSRRDFTINAMAMGYDGDILDIFGGRDDIKNGIIRCVREPSERFGEDALRILRAIRFCARFGFEFDPATLEAMKKCAPLLHNISGERIYNELSETLLSKYSAQTLAVCEDIIRELFPFFTAHEKLSNPYGDIAYRLFICIYGGGAKAINTLREQLKLSNAIFKKLTRLYDIYSRLCNAEESRIVFDDRVRMLMCDYPAEEIRDIFLFTDSELCELDSFTKNGVYSVKQLSVSGGDISGCGMFGKEQTAGLLKEALYSVACGRIGNSKEEIMEHLLKINF